MKSEESTFTVFNFSFITFPRQVFVGIFDINAVCISNKKNAEGMKEYRQAVKCEARNPC